LRNEYLAAEDRILRAQIKGRLLVSDAEKVTLAENRPPARKESSGRSGGGSEAGYASAWYRRLIANKFDGSKFRKSWSRPRVDEETKRLVEMARENPGWGYDRMVGAIRPTWD
jgi:putative transposase